MGRATLTEQMNEIVVCKYMGGWTHEQYLAEPYSKIISIKHMMREEADKAQRDAKKN